MEKQANSQKQCKNCVHYIAHYIKSRSQFIPIANGHCRNRKPSGHFRKTDAPCECYEERDFQKEKEEQLKSAEECLSFIAERLGELTQIFKKEYES